MKKYIKGLYIDTKETQFGEIIKIGVKVDEFKSFLNENQNEKGYVNIDILSNREKKKYAILNEYKNERNK